MTTAAIAEARGGNSSTGRDVGLTLVIVLVQVIIGLALSRYGVRFDGFFDVHRPVAQPVPLGVAILDQVAMIFAIAVGVAIVSPWRSHGSASTLAVVISMARLPVVLFAPAILLLPLPDAFLASTAALSTPSPLVVAAGVGATVAFVAAVALLAKGLRRLTDAHAWKLFWLTLFVFLMAESASKLALSAEKILSPPVSSVTSVASP